MTEWNLPKKGKMSGISVHHLVKLVTRSLFFLIATSLYIISKLRGDGDVFGGAEDKPVILFVVWLTFAVEIVLRLFPSRLESMGCQKQFAKNYKPTGEKIPDRQAWWRTLIMVALWLVGDGAVVLLYLLEVIDAGAVVLWCLALSVLDIVCILFFCPFQTFVMKNKCCGSCRIYNWDFIMMFSPLFFVPSPFAVSLAALAAVLFVVWEVTYRAHPERFAENTNCSLGCASCKEKLCTHKRQLRGFLKRLREKQLKFNKK